MSDVKYFVHVTEPTGDEYDIGPFEDLIGFMSNDVSALEWIYKQVGMLRIVSDSTDLIKHKWNCGEGESSLSNPVVEIDVEISGYRLEVRTLNGSHKNLVSDSFNPFM